MPLGTNSPTPYGGQLDRCQVCGDKYHREDLVRTQVDTMIAESENYLNFSSYDGSYWVCDAVDEGLIAYGNHEDEARTSLSDDNVITVVNGVQCWSGDGIFRATVTSPNVNPNSYVTFSAQVGANDDSTTPNMSVSLGIYKSDVSVFEEQILWQFNGCRRVYFTELASVLQAYDLGDQPGSRGFFFYIKVENDGEWWVDELQMEVGPVPEARPGVFLKTTGAVSSVSVDTPTSTTRVVCPDCFELVFRKSQKYGRTKLPPTAYPVRPRNQEY